MKTYDYRKELGELDQKIAHLQKQMNEFNKEISNLENERDELAKQQHGIEFDDVSEFLSYCFEHYDEDETLWGIIDILEGTDVSRGLLLEIDGLFVGFVNEIRTSSNGYMKLFVNDKGHLYGNGVIFNIDNISTIKVHLNQPTHEFFRM